MALVNVGNGTQGIHLETTTGAVYRVTGMVHFVEQVRKTPSWPRSWANFSLLWLYSHNNAWANLHLLGQPNTFLAASWSV